MSKTLLAVDDSATMRKVFEITFGGDDFNVLTADSRADALTKLVEAPKVVLIDTSLEGDDPYALCKEVRRNHASTVIFLMSSKFSPYDVGKGKDAGADDSLEKPFDTQAALDKVRKALLAKEGGSPVTTTSTPSPSTASHASPTHTETTPSLPSPVAAKAPVAASPQPKAAAPAAKPSVAHMTATATVTGMTAAKLSDLGLTPEQTQAVLAISREVVERVVWEVVPQLAETLIKEEIARLMK